MSGMNAKYGHHAQTKVHNCGEYSHVKENGRIFARWAELVERYELIVCGQQEKKSEERRKTEKLFREFNFCFVNTR